MEFSRLPESVTTVYAELLDQLRLAEQSREPGTSGSFVSKRIRGRTYWYQQVTGGGRKQQVYFGAESPALLERIRKASETRAAGVDDDARRGELVAMLVAGGMPRVSAPIASVLRVLAEACVFRGGGVLVGTQAFALHANMLGVRFPSQSLRTADVDVGHDPRISIGLSPGPVRDLLAELRREEPRFFAVPGLDPREPSTSFKVRGHDLRVDFLTPSRSRTQTEPVFLKDLGVAAQPLRGLDYLLEQSQPAAAIARAGTLVRVPSPARFALHKLWVSQQRSSAEQAKARKDLRQAEQLLAVLLEDRPEDVGLAARALASRRSMLREVRKMLPRVSENLRREIAPLLSG